MKKKIMMSMAIIGLIAVSAGAGAFASSGFYAGEMRNMEEGWIQDNIDEQYEERFKQTSKEIYDTSWNHLMQEMDGIETWSEDYLDQKLADYKQETTNLRIEEINAESDEIKQRTKTYIDELFKELEPEDANDTSSK